MLREWAEHLELDIETIHDGDEPYLPLSAPITFEDGTVLKDRTAFGQSVCVMVRKIVPFVLEPFAMIHVPEESFDLMTEPNGHHRRGRRKHHQARL